MIHLFKNTVVKLNNDLLNPFVLLECRSVCMNRIHEAKKKKNTQNKIVLMENYAIFIDENGRHKNWSGLLFHSVNHYTSGNEGK